MFSVKTKKQKNKNPTRSKYKTMKKIWKCFTQHLAGLASDPGSAHSWLTGLNCVQVQYLGGEGNGNPLQYSCLENPMDGGAWWAAVHGVARGRTRLSNFTFTFHFHALEKEMVTHFSVLAWRIPGTAEPGGLPSLGSHRVGHDWSDLAAANLTLFIFANYYNISTDFWVLTFLMYLCDSWFWCH